MAFSIVEIELRGDKGCQCEVFKRCYVQLDFTVQRVGLVQRLSSQMNGRYGVVTILRVSEFSV